MANVQDARELGEISATLKSIDARLQKIEGTLSKHGEQISELRIAGAKHGLMAGGAVSIVTAALVEVIRHSVRS